MYFLKNIVIVCYLCLFTTVVSLQAQQTDSINTAQKKPFLWNPFYNESMALKAQFLYPANTTLSINAPQKKVFVPKYYDLKNVLPENPLFTDYRYGSYYTPKIVQNHLALAMQRPSPDSFLPWPGLALLGAYAAYQYLIHKDQFEIRAVDYLVGSEDESVLFALWKKSPQTIAQLLKHPVIAEKETFQTLRERLNRMEGKRLIKSKEVENGPTKYFPAQKKAAVLLLLSNALEDEQLTPLQREKIAGLIKKIKAL